MTPIRGAELLSRAALPQREPRTHAVEFPAKASDTWRYPSCKPGWKSPAIHADSGDGSRRDDNLITRSGRATTI